MFRTSSETFSRYDVYKYDNSFNKGEGKFHDVEWKKDFVLTAQNRSYFNLRYDNTQINLNGVPKLVI